MKELNTHTNKNLLTALALLFITAFAAYWQVVTFSNCLKWDMVDQYFPWRYHVVSCLRSGELPLWNPYNFAGYPIHADPQSGAWYMPLWLFALFGQYGPKALAIDVFTHIWLAGIGMYALVNYLYRNHYIAIIAGVSYIGCGVLVGNAQHFTYIISACWLPFVILYFIKLLNTVNYRDALKLALLLWLFFTGGYPAFFIITGYILALASLIFYIGKLRKNEKPFKLIYLQLFTLLVFGLLASPSIISFALYWNETTRSGGIPLADALFGPFRIQDVPSFFVPMLSAIKKDNTGTDISMMNGYFGLLPLVAMGFILPLYKRLKAREIIILCISIVCLLAAFGNTFILPVRQWLYHLPALNIFRFPAIFRLFSIVGFILLGAWALTQLKQIAVAKKWHYAIFALGAVIITTLIFKGFHAHTLTLDLHGFHFIWAEFPGSTAAAFVGGIVQLVSLIALFFFWRNYKALVGIAILNTIIATQLNVPTTVINKEPTSVVSDFLKNMPNGYVDNKRVMGNEHFDAPSPLWRNLGIFYKQPSFDGNNPFRLKNFADGERAIADKYGNKPMVSSCRNATISGRYNTNNFDLKVLTSNPDTIVIIHNMANFWKVKVQMLTANTNEDAITGLPSITDEINRGEVTTVKLKPINTNFKWQYLIQCTYHPPYVFEFFITSLVVLFVVLLFMVRKAD